MRYIFSPIPRDRYMPPASRNGSLHDSLVRWVSRKKKKKIEREKYISVLLFDTKEKEIKDYTCYITKFLNMLVFWVIYVPKSTKTGQFSTIELWGWPLFIN